MSKYRKRETKFVKNELGTRIPNIAHHLYEKIKIKSFCNIPPGEATLHHCTHSQFRSKNCAEDGGKSKEISEKTSEKVKVYF